MFVIPPSECHLVLSPELRPNEMWHDRYVSNVYRAWLCLSKDSYRLTRGVEPWRETAGETYQWDDSVQRAHDPKPGDAIALWDDVAGMRGVSWIERIIEGRSTRRIPRCPKCGQTDVNERKTMAPRWKCKRQNCKAEFDQPDIAIKRVKTFTAEYSAGWTPVLEGEVPPRNCREICVSPKSQHSIREIDLQRFDEMLQRLGVPVTRNFDARKRSIHGGFGSATVRTRKGQNAFRKTLLARYGSVCAVTGSCPEQALDAAHLYRYSKLGEHHEDGGLLLRSDIHRLFDAGMLTVNPNTMTIEALGEASRSDYYSALSGVPLKIEVSDSMKVWLTAHWFESKDAPNSQGIKKTI